MKVSEEKFKTNSDATEYLDSTGWVYIGKKGMIRQYHLYKGVSMFAYGGYYSFKVRLYADGHVALYNDNNIRSIIYTGLPSRVWDSKEIYEQEVEILKDFNFKLRGDDYDLIYQIRDEGHNNFCLYKMTKQDPDYGFTTIKPYIKSFDTPHKAFAWAVSDLNT